MGMDVCISRAAAPPSAEAALALISAPVADWFRRRFGTPTLGQRLAWPAVGAGQNLLLSAPTGSGKTLAALLPIIDSLRGPTASDGVRCIYLAPLRALCNDLAAKLPALLATIGIRKIGIGLRTGDTSSYRRRRLWEAPPEILITTPESLALLLSHAKAEKALAGVQWLVVDEVHSLVGTKRGADLAISLERLSALAGRDPQRLGLSATCSPLDEVARWLAGIGRSITIASAADERGVEARLHYLALDDGQYHTAIVEHVCNALEGKGTTLVFADSRGTAERLVWRLRYRLPQLADRIAVHHGSLSAEVRNTIERQMQNGEMRLVVTSTSLELGIDIGGVDQVVMIRPPGGATRWLQRMGRAGHGPGRCRKGIVIATTGSEVVESAVTHAAGQTGQLEQLTVPKHPLDVVCQQLVGMGCQGLWTAAQAWRLIRRACPCRDLSLRDFADCLQYLSGSGAAETEYAARLRWRDHHFGIADQRTTRIYRRNAGTIASEPTREVRRRDGTLVGTVNDWFADQLQAGDRFLLAGNTYQVEEVRPDELAVAEAGGGPAMTGWEGSLWPVPQALAERLWTFRIRAKECLLDGSDALHRMLNVEYRLDDEPAKALARYLEEQETVSEIPTRGLLIESSPAGDGAGRFYCLHLPLAAPASAALGRVLAWRLGRGANVQSFAGCLGCALVTPEEITLEAESFRRLLTPAGFVADLDRAMAQSSLLRRRFQAAAETGLLVLRNPLGRRRRVGGRDWAGRRLFNWLRFADPNFPLLRQAMREVRQDCCDVDTVLSYLKSLEADTIYLRRLPEPSPFAVELMAVKAAPVVPHESLGSKPLAGTKSPSVLVHDHWLLTPYRAALHLPTFTAVIADVHLDYEAARRRGGDSVPRLGSNRLLQRLAGLFASHPVRRLLVAGDLVEDSRCLEAAREFVAWVRSQGIEPLLVPGNHDSGLPRLAGLPCHADGIGLGEWHVRHEWSRHMSQPQVVGHFHPMVRMPQPTPCFLVGARSIVLPAFSDDAAGGNVAGRGVWRSHQCFAIVGNEVRALSAQVTSGKRKRRAASLRSLMLSVRQGS